MDKFSSLEMFVASAETGSFSRAAERLGKTPSAVTKAIGVLENELGARLFERTTRSMSLTEAGQLYLDGAREVLERMRETTEEIAQLQHSLRGVLRITGPLIVGPVFLDQACAEFLDLNPDVRLQVDLSDSYVDLLDGRYDLALRMGNSDLPGLIAQPLGESRIALCASPAYLARRGTPLHPKEIIEHDCLIYRHPALDDRWWFDVQGERFCTPRFGRLNSDNQAVLLTACLAGHGLLPCPRWSVLEHLRSGRLVTVLDDFFFEPDTFGAQILAVYPSNRRATRRIQAFIEHLRDFLQRSGIA